MLPKLKIALKKNHVGAIFAALVGSMALKEFVALVVTIVGWVLITRTSRAPVGGPGSPQELYFDWDRFITQAVSFLLYFGVAYLIVHWLYIPRRKDIAEAAPAEKA